MEYFAILIHFCVLYIPGSYGVESLRIFIIGDMGGIDTEPYSTFVERSTAQEMGKIADLYSPQFIFSLGDNFYYGGVKNVDDKRFNLTFESVFSAESLQIPWYLIAGNHDHGGNVTAQIAYSQRSKRWNFPNLYYYKEFSIANNVTLGVVFMDTVQLCGMTDDFLTTQPQGPANKLDALKQWHFLKDTLKESRADYLFTAGHYPVYSIAEHGPTHCLVKYLQPMLESYRVNGHLSGHDHNLQHLQVRSISGDSINHFVSGMANFIDPSTKHEKSVPQGSSLFSYASSKGGFLYAETTVSNMTFTFINAEGVQLYSTVVFPRKA
ncbi:hypothetical protein BsWGS_19785 [Bradybaena similaris]